MTETLTPDLCVIGAGAGGLSVAAGAAQMGASVVLVEKGAMGGDCLNTGCVPSKALLAAGHAAARARRAAGMGVVCDPVVDAARVRAHVADAIAAIAPHDSVDRFEGLGVRVIQAAARFTGPREVKADHVTIHARRFVIATGASAFVPPIGGLDDIAFLTNESLFDLHDLPDHLIVLGGGPIGVEMAQAHANLGCRVTVLEMGAILSQDDPDLVCVVRERLQADGIDVREGVAVATVEKTTHGIRASLNDGTTVDGSHVLVAAGRRAHVDGLDLKVAGIDHGPQGIVVDGRLRTSNKKVFAIGDVIGGAQFTHVAGYHAGIVIRNALFRLPARARRTNIPWVTYTDPELASVGLNEADARREHGDDVRVLRADFTDNDRARAEADTTGFLKAVTDKRGRILGCAIVGSGAGELIQPWTLALENKLKIGAMASTIAPYPTRGEISKRAAGSFYTDTLFGPRTRWLVRLLARFG